MGRKKTESNIPFETEFLEGNNEAAFEKSQEATTAMAMLQSDYNDRRDLVNQILGQVQMANAISKFSLTLGVSKLAFIKENKHYRQFKGVKIPEKTELLKGTWAEFCNLLGCSVDKVDEDIKNLKTFGEEAMESMARMGLGYRELRQLRKLPEDEIEAARTIAESGDDKEGLLEYITDMAVKHAKEKETLEKQNSELEKNHEAKEKQLIKKDQKINELDRKIGELEDPKHTITWQKQCQEVNIEVTNAAAKALEGLDQIDTLRDSILFESASLNPEDGDAAIEMMAVFYYDALDQIISHVVDLSQACHEVFGSYKNIQQARLATEMPGLSVVEPDEK